MNTGAKSAADLMAEDLAKSGLQYQDLLARILDENSRNQVNAHENTRGYVIPYFNLYGKLTQYYRVKVIGDPNVKYLQMKGAPNHIYFPKNFGESWGKTQGKYCMITEGEKKACLVSKMGIPCIALSGVDSWRNKTLILPKGVEQGTHNGAVTLKLPAATIDEHTLSAYALGLEDLMNLGYEHHTTFIICFDTDSPKGLTMGPQRSAARLGYELRFKGFPLGAIRQLVVPYGIRRAQSENATVEDIILNAENPERGTENLLGMIQETLDKRVAFPRHPMIREHISRQLQKSKLDRKTIQNVSLSVLTELDSKGTRMHSPDDLQMYYFNGDDKHLMKVNINTTNLASAQEGEFGILLYRDFNLSLTADTALTKWLGTQFAAEQPVEKVRPFRIVARPKPNEDIVRFQISNGQYIKVTGDPQKPYTIMANGAENTLFESQNLHIDGIDEALLKEELKKQHGQPIECWWNSVIKEVKLKNPGRQGDLISLLYYISPWLLGWRGIQLPIEIVTGEAGSGKSTLCEIRLNILTGDPKLRNTPHDQKDWLAVLANCGGLTITDNVHMTDKNLRQSMSDELCRLVTELTPRIQMRKYFTEADERSILVNSTFGFTAIQMPFQNSDLLQRSICLELIKNTTDSRAFFDSHWKDRQLSRYGGRTAWVAHHCVALHRFFQRVSKEWNNEYKAKHRLVNLEQSLIIMARVFGMEWEWIPDFLAEITDAAITNADWVIEGLMDYAEEQLTAYRVAEKNWKYNPKFKPYIPHTFVAGDIADWASEHEEHKKCYQLINSRSLGRYMQNNKSTIAHITGIVEVGKKGNKIHYRATPTGSAVRPKDTE